MGRSDYTNKKKGEERKDVVSIGDKIMASVSIFYYPEEHLFKDSHNHILLNIYKVVPPLGEYIYSNIIKRLLNL
jgi:hypothetical protein